LKLAFTIGIKEIIYPVIVKVLKILKIDEFLSNLPSEVISGSDITIADTVFRNIFKFAKLSFEDIFYYIGFGNNIHSLKIAKEEFGVKKVIGIEQNDKFLQNAKNQTKNIKGIDVIKKPIEELDISQATILFFWFNDVGLIDKLRLKIEKEMKIGSRLVTLLSPPGFMLPSVVDFPFIMCIKPFIYASDLKQQIKSIYGNSCLDFTASWQLSENYIKKLKTPTRYSRFINILLSMTIWINAWNNGVSCEKDIPPPVESYIGILNTFFNIDLKDMILKK
jgi:hypothetical protein